MKTLKKCFIETLPITIGVLLSYLFWQNTLLLLILYTAISIGLIVYHKDKSEWLIFVYGIILGSFIEIIGTQISGYQSFTKADILGIPFWLPIAWGYAFVAMKRIGRTLNY